MNLLRSYFQYLQTSNTININRWVISRVIFSFPVGGEPISFDSINQYTVHKKHTSKAFCAKTSSSVKKICTPLIRKLEVICPGSPGTRIGSKTNKQKN